MTFGAQAQTWSGFSKDTDEGGIRRVLARIFREREVIIRTDGEVQFLRIGPRLQMATAGVLLASAIWAATAVPVTVTQGRTISVNNEQILEAKLAYEDLLAEITAYQQNVDELTATLRDSRTTLQGHIAEVEATEQSLAKQGERAAGARAAVAMSREAMRQHLDVVNMALAGIATDGEDLENMVAKVRADLAGSEDGRTLVARARARLKERAESLEVRLASVVEHNQRVEEANSGLSSNLKMTTAERDGLLEQRENLRARIATLSQRLAELDELRQNLESHNAELASNLESSRNETAELIAERYGLQEQLAALDGELQLTRAEQDAFQQDLLGVAQSLKEITGDPTELAAAHRPLRTQIDSLLAELTNQQAAEELVLQRATERAASSVQEIEKIIAMTGLKVDRLLSRVRSSELGQGGPFIAASAEIPGEDELGETMLTLDSSMNRWMALTEVLRALPLSLPVDYYHLTSDFGPRTDPVNKRRSMHYGLDMAGWLKSSVWAAAPGTVVYSSKKGRYGYVVEIDHGFGIRTRYAHLHKNLVKVGDVVGHRQRIALLGSSGRSTGPHLHYEVLFDGKPLDPMNFIKAGRYVFKN